MRWINTAPTPHLSVRQRCGGDDGEGELANLLREGVVHVASDGVCDEQHVHVVLLHPTHRQT